MRNQRRQIWIDRYQTHLFLRIVTYCVLYQAAVWTFVAVERSLVATFEDAFGRDVSIGFYVAVALGAILLGAAFVRDAIKIAHRVVGPIYRFRKAVQAITAGDDLPLVRLRDGDYLTEFQDEFNEMLRVLEQRGAVTLKHTAAQPEKEQPVAT